MPPTKKCNKMKGGSKEIFENENIHNSNSKLSQFIINIPIIMILLFVIGALIIYIYSCHTFNVKNVHTNPSHSPTIFYSGNNVTKNDSFNDPYYPPLKNEGVFFPNHIIKNTDDNHTMITSLDGISNRAINIRTRGDNPDFSQIGILTKQNTTNAIEPKILPLMGRRVMNGRSKYQYYTISNSGNVNTKLPVRKNGRNCVNEYGCDELFDGEDILVEGYDDKFKVTIYENNTFQYIP